MRRLLRGTLGALVCVGALGALPSAHAQDREAPPERRVLRGMHDQIRFEREVARVAVGDEKVLSAEVLSSRSILLLGQETGRTSLLVWFADDTMEAFVVTVQPDLDLLQRALHDIHPGITAEMAPDRAAVVLRGVVPDVSYVRAAEAAANSYLRAGRGDAGPLVAAAPEGAPAATTVRAPSGTRSEGSVINLIRVESLPLSSEQRIEEAARRLGAYEVRAERLVRGDLNDDAADVLVLRGRVRDQVTLTRVLQVASTLFLGTAEIENDLRVTADEAGGLVDRRQRGGSSGGSSSQGSLLSGGSGSGSGGLSLDNDIESNIARAKAVSLAGGRILSFLDVTDVPQVRVDIRIYEVNRTKLLEYAPQFSFLWSDFDQARLLPATGATAVQGIEAARVGGLGDEDLQGVLGFLADGFTQEVQISGRHYAIDAVLQILESRGLARSLANPSLTVLSGEDANFQVGGEVPIPLSFAPAFGTTTTAGDTTPGVFSAVEFRAFGVELAVRPLVGENGDVTLDLFSQVDQPDEQLTTLIREATGTDQSTTAFESRTINTTARLKDGQSLLIGGLISRRSTDSTSFTPGLEQAPVIGWLFKRFSVQDEDRELVIVVNPTVVRDRIADLGVWRFPDVSVALRDWVDATLEFHLGDEWRPREQ